MSARSGSLISRLRLDLKKVLGWADKIHGLTVLGDGLYHIQIRHEPIGVAEQIIPWNFPLIMLAWKVRPTLMCDNTIVLKTIEQTPWTALYVAKLFHEAGLPPSVLNVVFGFGPTAGTALAGQWMWTWLLSRDQLR
ncbi:hypothetical protein Nepgr_030810 [Nepenthes gracilis]|uniref:Aldehyde dehydrogenase domain-containing protein n=1 Tax=Nepenthes gracilis TaxID=150966 RepID=A0AAD3THN9_NEPGR|nr:hypothetical protein Nepgr_030810 [Nepenthes gracilis]